MDGIAQQVRCAGWAGEEAQASGEEATGTGKARLAAMANADPRRGRGESSRRQRMVDARFCCDAGASASGRERLRLRCEERETGGEREGKKSMRASCSVFAKLVWHDKTPGN